MAGTIRILKPGSHDVAGEYPAQALLRALKEATPHDSKRVALAFADPLTHLDGFKEVLLSGDVPVVLNPRLPQEQRRLLAQALHCRRLLGDEGEEVIGSSANTAVLSHLENARGSDGHSTHVFCSSGTSAVDGRPKAFVFRLDRSLANGAAHMRSLGFAAPAAPQADSRPRILLPMPISHSFGMMAGVMGSIQYDADLFIAPNGLSAQGILDVVTHVGIDTLYLTPSHVKQLIALLARKPHLSTPALARISIGSSVLFSQDLLHLMSRFPGTSFFATYGLTELGPRVSTFSAGYGASPASALLDDLSAPVPLGEAIDGVSLEVRNECLWVRSEYQALGLPTDERGFFDTQDRIAWSGQGLPRITGRQDDTIIRAGINIYPDEIECHVGSIEGVNAFCLVGLPSSTYGQVPVLACEVDDAQDHETIRSALMEKLAASLPESHVPARIHFSTHLPKTALGKLQRKRVAEQIAKEDRGG